MGIPWILGGYLPRAVDEHTVHSGAGWLHRGKDSPVPSGGKKMNERYDIQKDGVVR